MPELPEVEIIKRGLEKEITGKIFKRAEVFSSRSIIFDSKRLKNIKAAESILNNIYSGLEVKSISRKGKIIFIDFGKSKFLAVHLKMTGRIRVLFNNKQKLLHERVRIYFGRLSIAFVDTRKFGYIEVLKNRKELKKKLDNLGPDAFKDLKSPDDLKEIINSSSPIKSVLLNQTKISGIGNAYCDEILHKAGVSPFRASNNLSNKEINDLYFTTIELFEKGIESSGLTIRDFVDVYGNKGNFQNWLKVYSKKGEDCKRCGNKIKRKKLRGRSTYYCSSCQI